MAAILENVSAWLTAGIVGSLMLGGWGVGRWQGQRLKEMGNDGSARQLTDATVAILGLLLAFTFSMSLTKHDQRRQMLVRHANAIGDFYSCASLLKDPVKTKLQGVIREYVQTMVKLGKEAQREKDVPEMLRKNEAMHNQMLLLVKDAVDDGTPVVVPLVNTFNDVTSSHDARMAAVRDRLPPSIVLLLCMAAIISMVLEGMHRGKPDEREFMATVGFILLVSMSLWVTLDLNQPQQGAIRVNQESMQRLLSSMSE